MNDLTKTQKTEMLTNVDIPLDQNPAAVYLACLQPTGRRSQRTALGIVANLLTDGAVIDPFSLAWQGLRYQHVAAIRSKLIELYKPATVNRTLCAVRGVLKAAWRLGLIDGDDYHRAVDVESVSGSTIPAGRELSRGELAALMTDCANDPTASGARDATIIALMYSCGLRRDEVANLVMENYEKETGLLVVVGKRSKERTAYLINGAAAAMSDWLILRGDEPGALFCAINKSGVIIPGKLTNQAIYNILIKRGIGAGIKQFSPHDLRRTFVSDLLDAGADIATVAKMAGHSSVNTTARYDRRPEETKRKAAGLLHIPYISRIVRQAK